MRLLKQAAIVAALIFCALPTLMPVASFAQELATVATSEPTVLQQILVFALPALFGVVSIVSLLIYAEIKRRFGIEIEAQHRLALQSALENGIRWALQQAGWLPQQDGKPKAVLDAAAGYVISSVPDALKQFGIDAATSTGKAKLERLLTPHLPLPAGTVMPNGDTLVGRAP